MGGQRKGTGTTTSGAATGSRRTTRRPVQGAGQAPIVQQEGYNSPVQAVFGQEELLEMILDYAIHDKNAAKRVETLRAVRLVNKSWLTEVTNITRKNKEPMFKLKLTKDNSLNGAPFVEAKGKLLNEFAKSIKNRVVKEPFPTFSLKLLKEFFRRENYQSLVDFLSQCSKGLVRLELIIPENGGSLPGGMMSRIVDLPILQKILVSFSGEKVAANLPEDELDFGNKTNVVCLLQSFLSRAKSLKEFLVKYPGGYTSYAPFGFEMVTLPNSITKLDLPCRMTTKQLEMLATNKLPNLLNLELLLDSILYSDGLLSKILNNFGEHLQSFMVSGIRYQGPPRVVNLVRFPVMNELTLLSFYSTNLELDAEHPLLSECFPKLNTLNLYYQTLEMLRKWTTGGPLDLVEDLRLCVIDENKPRNSSGSILPLKLEVMQSIHLTFPNVSKLTLEMSLGVGTQECGLKYLFMEMKQLIYLRVKVHETQSILNSDYWDSIFTGVPVTVIKALRETPEFGNHFELKDSAPVPSIKMLTELRILSLEAVVECQAAAAHPLISDLTFTFALLKMAKLKNLYLYGRFRASGSMTETWKKSGRGRGLKYGAHFQEYVN